MRYKQVGKSIYSYPDMNMSLESDTTVDHLIWMWILVLLENPEIIVISQYINMLSSKDTMNLANVSPSIQIWICCWKLVLQSFICLDCEYLYQGLRQREVLWYYSLYALLWDTNHLLNITSPIWLRIWDGKLILQLFVQFECDFFNEWKMHK